jgi:hypothetical protein
MDRRAMLRAAAIAGVGAWTAPAIIDSLASPAAAASGQLPSGTYLYYFGVSWTSGSCAVTLLSTATQGNFTTSMCTGTRVQCGDVGDVAVTALFNGTATGVNGCGSSTAACPGLAGPPVGPNQGLCFSTSQGTITGFDASAFNVATNPAGLPGAGYGCLFSRACTFSTPVGLGAEVFAPTNTNPSGTSVIVSIQVTVP